MVSLFAFGLRLSIFAKDLRVCLYSKTYSILLEFSLVATSSFLNWPSRTQRGFFTVSNGSTICTRVSGHNGRYLKEKNKTDMPYLLTFGIVKYLEPHDWMSVNSNRQCSSTYTSNGLIFFNSIQ